MTAPAVSTAPCACAMVRSADSQYLIWSRSTGQSQFGCQADPDRLSSLLDAPPAFSDHCFRPFVGRHSACHRDLLPARTACVLRGHRVFGLDADDANAALLRGHQLYARSHSTGDRDKASSCGRYPHHRHEHRDSARTRAVSSSQPDSRNFGSPESAGATVATSDLDRAEPLRWLNLLLSSCV
jgi:hypothetical protein